MATVARLPHEQEKVYGKKSLLSVSITAVLRKNNGYRSTGRGVVSYPTQRARSDIIKQGVNYVFDEGYKLTDVKGFKRKHMKVMVQGWIKNDLAAKTIKNRLSVFKTFMGWINKHNVVEELKDYTDDPALLSVSTVSKEDKSWTSHGVDPREKIDEIWLIQPLVAYQLELMWAFGLRPKEAFLLKAVTTSFGASLSINFGAKGGRDRTIPIRTKDQMLLLNLHFMFANKTTGSLVPSGMSLKQWSDKFYNTIRKFGICKNTDSGEGITAYGLRHEYANYLFQLISGSESVLRAEARGHQIDVIKKDLEDLACHTVATELGHGRTQITGAYIGTRHSSPAARRAREEFCKKMGFNLKELDNEDT